MKGHITLGPKTQLVSEDHFISQLRPLGMGKRGFRGLCRALKVPLFYAGSGRRGTAFVNVRSLQLALHAVTRIGEPDFYAPGSKWLAEGSAKGVRNLDEERFRKNMPHLLAELIAHERGVNPGLEAVKQEAKAFCTRLNAAMLQQKVLEARDTQVSKAMEQTKEIWPDDPRPFRPPRPPSEAGGPDS